MATTAFEDALNQATAGGYLSSQHYPSYLTEADTSKITNNEKTFLEDAFDIVESVPKFIGVSLISGANQLYNIPPSIGNLFSEGSFKERDTQTLIDDNFGENLGSFYRDNKEGADLVGFIASSLVPGIGAVKAVNFGQKALQTSLAAGKLTGTMGKALGLLVDKRGLLLNAAKIEVATNSSAASLLTANSLRYLGQGVKQGLIESLAFETAVSATLFNSPILENQDMGDFISNVVFGAGIYGIVGGVVDAAKLSSTLNRVAKESAQEARPWTFIEGAAPASTSYEKIALDYDQLNSMPSLPEGLTPEKFKFLSDAAKTKVTTLENRIRAEFSVLARGDENVAETMFQALKKTSAADQSTATRGLVDVASYSTPDSKIAKAVGKLEAKVLEGKASMEEIEAYTNSVVSTSYTRTWGEHAGKTMTDAPVITSLSDLLKKGETILVDNNGVRVVNANKVVSGRKFSFSTKRVNGDLTKSRPWDILNADSLSANARYIWASKLQKFAPSAEKPIHIDVDDLPMMEKVYHDLKDTPELTQFVKFRGMAKGESVPEDLFKYIADKKIQLSNKLLEVRGERSIVSNAAINEATEKATEAAAKKTLVQDEIAAIVNVKSPLLSGNYTKGAVSEFDAADIFAMQDYTAEYTKMLLAKGSRKINATAPVDLFNIPQTLKLTYDPSSFKGVDNFAIANIAHIKEKQKLYQQGMDAVVMQNLGGEAFSKLETITTGRVYNGAVPSGAGPGLVKAADGNYGTLASSVTNLGRTTTTLAEQAKKKALEVLDPLAHKMGNNKEAAIEWSVLNNKLRGIEGEYGLNAAGDALEPALLLRYRAAVAEATAAGKKAPAMSAAVKERVAKMEASIPIQNIDTRNMIKAHIELNSGRTHQLAAIRTAQGSQFNRSPDVFYPIPVNPKEFPHFALVIDDSVTATNHMKTLYATSAEELRAMAAKVSQNEHLTILYKQDAENYYKARGQFNYEKTISDNYLDVEAHRRGVSMPHYVPTDPKKIVDDMITWHMDREVGTVRENIAAKYEVQFNEILDLGKEFTKSETSKFSSSNLAYGAEDLIKNPYNDYIKTALGITKKGDYPLLTNINMMADKAVSAVLRRAATAISSPSASKDLTEVNAMLRKAGYKGAAYDAESALFANAGVSKGYLNTIVQKANSMLATVVLRWDAINAANNAISANVLLGAETAAIMRAIKAGDEEAVGALAKLTQIAIPEGGGKTMFSPQKLIGKAIMKFGRIDKASPEYAFYESNGFLTTISKQYKDSIDNLTFKGDVGEWSKRVNKVQESLQKLGDKGEYITGNTLAEEFNRFVAADVMKQMSDVAVQRGLMSAQEQLAYINTFVNRTQGNYLAAQRPLLFQGAVGQSIGLFQTYQFNLLQQLLRHVGEGHTKDTLTLLGLQGTIHGMNGMPAFNFLNTSLIGNASGNSEHKDTFDAVYGIAGKEAGDWMMYGLGSNFLGLVHPDLKMNLYTRGDINPRHLTIVPTNLVDVPWIQASGKVIGNILDTAKTLGKGGDVSTTLLQGLEHNGASRPLAGLAQTLQGFNNVEQASYSTSSKGNVIAANDLSAIANLGRILGAKPLDEAVALDAVYRYKAYALKDNEKRQSLSKAIKTTMIAGGDPTKEQIENFAAQYAKIGGTQQSFSQWAAELYKTANLSQANALQQNLNTPFSQSMQRLMGGEELRDFTP